MATTILQNVVLPVLLVLSAGVSLPAVRAAAQPSQLCTCSDLLWRPEAPHVPEVVNVHSKYLAELSEAEAHGVRSPSMRSAVAGVNTTSVSQHNRRSCQ